MSTATNPAVIQRFDYGRLRLVRKWAKLTQAEVGRRIGVNHRTVSSWESGERTPTLDNLMALASAMGVSPAAFITVEPSHD